MSVYTNPTHTATQAFFARMAALRARNLTPPKSPIVSGISFDREVISPPKHIFGNGFLTSYTLQHREEISASKFFVIDAETTGLTPFSKPISIGGSAKIGPEWTWSVYKKLHAASLNVRLRMRVWALQTSTGARMAWDLDKLSPEEIKQLLRDTIHEKVLVGHNLAFDFTWAVNICGRDLCPALVLDTMLLARCIKPAAMYAVHRLAAKGDENAQAVIGKSGNASVSLGALSVGLGLGTPDKSWQHPRNWAVSTLSPGHYEYVLGDIDHPLQMLLRWGQSTNFQKALENLRAQDAHLGGAYFDVYAKAPLALAKISHTGMPVHVPTLRAVQQYRRAEMPALVAEVLRHMPDMAEYTYKLEAQSPATLAPMKLVLAAYAEKHDCKLDENEDGEPVINSKHAKIKGASELPGWVAWAALQNAKKLLALCEEYMGISGADEPGAEYRQLHPLFSSSLATARVSAKVPNTMNLPRPGQLPADFFPLLPNSERQEAWNAIQFRAVVRAPDGHTLISADYGQIELRIAAALALRAISDAKRVIGGETSLSETKGWFIEALRVGEDLSIELEAASVEDEGFAAFSNNISRVWRRLVTSPARPMADAFRAGLDPHLLTGITLAARQGLLDLEGSHPIDFLRGRSAIETEALKKKFGAQRQSAKALNFGLLYGMQAEKLYTHGIVDYNLSWSLDDAKESRAAWFDLFPEIAFLQLWHQLALMPGKKEAETLYRKNNYTHAVGLEKTRIGASATLRGRPVVATEAREILNYADQGTGADMLLEAVTSMPGRAFDCVIDLIHDEVLMCVPNAILSEVKGDLEAAMLGAANRVLSPYTIPAEAEGDEMLFWRKN